MEGALDAVENDGGGHVLQLRGKLGQIREGSDQAKPGLTTAVFTVWSAPRENQPGRFAGSRYRVAGTVDA